MCAILNTNRQKKPSKTRRRQHARTALQRAQGADTSARNTRAERGVRGRQHRRQDGQRAAVGARAARLGADARPPAEATLGPALFPATPRCARRRCQTRHHIPKGPRYPQQTHAGEVPKAER